MSDLAHTLLNTTRFDTKLVSCSDMITLFSNTPDRIKELGKRVIAIPSLCPAEPIYAAGGLAYNPYVHEVIPAWIKGKTKLITKATDAGLSPSLNPWNLVMAGAAISSENEVVVDAYSAVCGYWDDQVSNTWQLMAETGQKPIHFWEIPRFDHNSQQWAIKLLIGELEQFFKWLAVQTGSSITEGSLKEAVRVGNLIRQDVIELNQLLQSQRVPIPALEYYITQVMTSDFAQDPENLHNLYQKIIHELKERQLRNIRPTGIIQEPVRIFFMGEEIPDIRIWNEIEDYGGVIIGLDSRLSLYYKPIKEDGSAIVNIAQWIYSMLCNLPLTERINEIIPFIKQQKSDAIIFSSIVGSKIIPESEALTSRILQDELGIPIFSLKNEQHFTLDRPANVALKTFMENLKDSKNRGEE